MNIKNHIKAIFSLLILISCINNSQLSTNSTVDK